MNKTIHYFFILFVFLIVGHSKSLAQDGDFLNVSVLGPTPVTMSIDPERIQDWDLLRSNERYYITPFSDRRLIDYNPYESIVAKNWSEWAFWINSENANSPTNNVAWFNSPVFWTKSLGSPHNTNQVAFEIQSQPQRFLKAPHPAISGKVANLRDEVLTISGFLEELDLLPFPYFMSIADVFCTQDGGSELDWLYSRIRRVASLNAASDPDSVRVALSFEQISDYSELEILSEAVFSGRLNPFRRFLIEQCWNASVKENLSPRVLVTDESSRTINILLYLLRSAGQAEVGGKVEFRVAGDESIAEFKPRLSAVIEYLSGLRDERFPIDSFDKAVIRVLDNTAATRSNSLTESLDFWISEFDALLERVEFFDESSTRISGRNLFLYFADDLVFADPDASFLEFDTFPETMPIGSSAGTARSQWFEINQRRARGAVAKTLHSKEMELFEDAYCVAQKLYRHVAPPPGQIAPVDVHLISSALRAVARHHIRGLIESEKSQVRLNEFVTASPECGIGGPMRLEIPTLLSSPLTLVRDPRTAVAFSYGDSIFSLARRHHSIVRGFERQFNSIFANPRQPTLWEYTRSFGAIVSMEIELKEAIAQSMDQLSEQLASKIDTLRSIEDTLGDDALRADSIIRAIKVLQIGDLNRSGSATLINGLDLAQLDVTLPDAVAPPVDWYGKVFIRSTKGRQCLSQLIEVNSDRCTPMRIVRNEPDGAVVTVDMREVVLNHIFSRYLETENQTVSALSHVDESRLSVAVGEFQNEFAKFLIDLEELHSLLVDPDSRVEIEVRSR